MNHTFAKDIIKGFSNKEKHLSSKYFYDDNGSKIFQEIMQMPEYYLTNSEFEILSLQAQQIIEAVNFKQPFNIIELGAGDGFKTFKLLEYLVHNHIDFQYIPIDISEGAMNNLVRNLKERLPNLKINPKIGDYFDVLNKENVHTQTPSLLLFLGSNIGNYLYKDAVNLMELFNKNMKKGDKLLLGADLKKNPRVIQFAYDDPHKITKRFNINLLLRINKEFEGDFKIDDFDFYCHYNPINGEVRSYLISLRKQTVYLKKIAQHFNFDYNELIWTELSKKYDLEELSSLAQKTNFSVEKHFLDCKHYFTDTLLRK
ncbi:L-histidine N(alpha)-methyltransferase [Tenacibaculum maritimum]|uniref:L-histidine N(alpha)-methyltransferase n=1 Tax=Tenacibaculum maritimum TaxID=107401 RepID=UPI0012E69B84|nr:L-histidine N(alpha)-methyltransferase [Tenacibaculum maritimum]CAA0164070.1 Putative methyltransferase [Tenacibaculum maritimum]CAA0215665.1 Putative methyltransferase [Tenacibaculum maritimum]CAA0251495.1 Putative methyltransferase [Tenacibaculum maritimum]